MSISSIEDVETYLEAIPKFSSEGKSAADFTLERFKNFCESIDNPQQRFPAVHVAGSNGKSSTCRFIASICREAGYKTGLYTSPHLVHFSERFTVNGTEIPEKALVLFFKEYLPKIESFNLTYFEISTAVAFWWFARNEVDIAVIETGLGGRLDATNIFSPLVSVITSVTLDHTDILGDSLQVIAREKAGIIKPNTPTVTGNLPEEARPVITQVAENKNSQLKGIEGLHPQGRGGTYQLNVGDKVVEFSVPMQAPVQAYNMAMAWQTATLLNDQFEIDELQIRQGIEHGASLYPARGHFERLHPQFRWYFDGAHNPEAVQAMKQAVETVGAVNKAVLVLTLMKDKINKKMLNELLDFKKIVYYTLPTKRGANQSDIVEWLPQVNSFPEDQKSRLSLLDELKGELVIFGGSFYFYSTVKDWITSYMNGR